MMAVRISALPAAAPFYGGQPADEDVPKINAKLLLHYAELDARVNKGWPDYEAALQANEKQYTAHMYPEANHGFHNDTTPRYNQDAAELAWQRTVAFFKAHCGSLLRQTNAKFFCLFQHLLTPSEFRISDWPKEGHVYGVHTGKL